MQSAGNKLYVAEVSRVRFFCILTLGVWRGLLSLVGAARAVPPLYKLIGFIPLILLPWP
jgi:hypothetical protein